ncbi:MAG: NUDIX hydrolase, partial [Parachlamydiales bacterium]|nr:NUDIX hydrolase [Parachlamydiales bacterium]
FIFIQKEVIFLQKILFFIMFYLKMPQDFISQKDIVICYLVHNDQFLLLRRNFDKFKGGTWTAPGGKKESFETTDMAVIREVFEETKIKIQLENLIFVNKCYITHDDFHFTMHIFKTFLKEKPNIILHEEENDKYIWTTVKEAEKLNLIEHADECLKNSFL